MTPKAVIFDFDGVILESAEIKTQAFLDLFSDHPQHREAILRHHLDNVGVSRYRKFEWIYSQLLQMPLEKRESQHLGKAFSDIALGKILACSYVPGALESLEQMQGGARLFIASGTPQEELDLIVDRRDLRRFFTGVHGTPRTKVEIITMILAEFNLQADDAIFVGDGMSDYQAALETSVPFVARESPAGGVDWFALGVDPLTDLRELAARIRALESTKMRT